MALVLLCYTIPRSVFSKSTRDGRLHGISAKWYPCWSRNFAAPKAQKLQALKKKRRLDEICLERFQQYSRTFIQSWIIQGKVIVNGRVVNKAGTPISDQAIVEIMAEVPKYVCRAGYKLEAAIEQLGVDVCGKVALDSGLSTGGFTDCLLQYGASFVYGVDVGYGQVAEKIRRDERVCVIERTNLRYLSELPQKVMPAVISVMKHESTLVTLVKPQFEARRSQVSNFSNGVFGANGLESPGMFSRTLSWFDCCCGTIMARCGWWKELCPAVSPKGAICSIITGWVVCGFRTNHSVPR